MPVGVSWDLDFWLADLSKRSISKDTILSLLLAYMSAILFIWLCSARVTHGSCRGRSSMYIVHICICWACPLALYGVHPIPHGNFNNLSAWQWGGQSHLGGPFCSSFFSPCKFLAVWHFCWAFGTLAFLLHFESSCWHVLPTLGCGWCVEAFKRSQWCVPEVVRIDWSCLCLLVNSCKARSL